MSRILSIAGWLLFVGVIVALLFGYPRDGQLITSMKANGSYDKVLAAGVVILGILFLYLVRQVKHAMWCEGELKKRIGE